MSEVKPATVSRLAYGIVLNGVTHYEFDLRLPTIGDNIAVFEANADASMLAVNVAILARCLTRLGSADLVGVDVLGLLKDGLIDDDYDVLWSALTELKKKQKAASAPPESCAVL